MEDFINNDNVKKSTRIKTETVKKGTVTEENENTETVNIKTVNEETVRRETVNEETVRRETVNKDTVRRASVNEETVRRETVNEDTVRRASVNEETVRRVTVNEETVNMVTLKKETVMEWNIYYSCGQGLKLVESETQRRLGAKENVRRNYYPKDIRPDSTSELSGVVHYEEVKPDILFNNGMLSSRKSRYRMGGNKNMMRLCLKKKLPTASPEVEFTREEEGGGIHFIPITDNP